MKHFIERQLKSLGPPGARSRNRGSGVRPFPRVRVRLERAIFAGLVLLALGLAGCATTPERRAQQHPEVFEALPPEVQENVLAGQVEIGYTPDMVFLALGAPDRKVTRRTENEQREIWVYQGRFVTTETVRVYDQFGRFRPVRSPIYLDRTVEHRYTRARLEFVEGKLVSLEQTER